MTINEIMNERKLSKYRLANNTGIPYSTISDICNGKSKLEKCTAETIYKIARELNVSMESILESHMIERDDFELFKSSVCHQLKELKDIDFIVNTLQKDMILEYYERKWYPECFYMLAMLDYISKENNVPICTKYDLLRTKKLDKPIIPVGIKTLALVLDDNTIIEQAYAEAIPEFLQYNILESEVRIVV